MEQQLTPLLENAFLLLLAKDKTRKARFKEVLISKIKKEQNLKEVDVENFEYTNISDLNYKLNSQSLFSKFKVVNVSFKKEINSEESQKLCEIAKSVPLKTFLILDTEKIKANLKITKLAKAKKSFIEFKQLNSNDLAKWIKDECKRVGIKKFPEALAQMLQNICEDDLDQITKNIDLLSIYCDGNDLSLKELKNFYPEALAPNEFKLIDAITTGNSSQTEQLLSELFAAQKSPFLILAMLNNNFKKLLNIKVMQVNGENSRNIMSSMNLADWLYKKLATQVRNLSIFKLKKILSHLLKADSRLKDKSLGPELVLSQVCGDLCKIYQK